MQKFVNSNTFLEFNTGRGEPVNAVFYPINYLILLNYAVNRNDGHYTF